MQDKRKSNQKANEEEGDTLTVSPSPVPIKYILGYFGFQHFKHFQQVFNKMLHNDFRHFDGLSTIQHVFNNSFNSVFLFLFTFYR